MKERIQVLNMLLLAVDRPSERKQYLEDLGTEYEYLQQSSEVFIDTNHYVLYTVVYMDDFYWLGENALINIAKNTYQADTIETIARIDQNFGYYEAQESCPKNCVFPSAFDWQLLLKDKGGYQYSADGEGYEEIIIGNRPNSHSRAIRTISTPAHQSS